MIVIPEWLSDDDLAMLLESTDYGLLETTEEYIKVEFLDPCKTKVLIGLPEGKSLMQYLNELEEVA